MCCLDESENSIIEALVNPRKSCTSKTLVRQYTLEVFLKLINYLCWFLSLFCLFCLFYATDTLCV